MRWKLACGAVGALVLGAAAAQASDATVLADRAGFLVGHAHRCGVAPDRLERSETLVSELILAVSSDVEDRQAAQARFAERALASALADLLAEPVPDCTVVRSEIARLTQHQRPATSPAANQREGQMARNDRSGSGTAQSSRSARAKPAKSAKPASTRREDLTVERRAAIELRRAAQQTRGKPPSI